MIQLLKKWAQLEPEWCKDASDGSGNVIYISDANPFDEDQTFGWGLIVYEAGVSDADGYYNGKGDAIRHIQFAVQCAIEERGWDFHLLRFKSKQETSHQRLWQARVYGRPDLQYGKGIQEGLGNPAEALLTAYLQMIELMPRLCECGEPAAIYVDDNDQVLEKPLCSACFAVRSGMVPNVS